MTAYELQAWWPRSGEPVIPADRAWRVDRDREEGTEQVVFRSFLGWRDDFDGPLGAVDHRMGVTQEFWRRIVDGSVDDEVWWMRLVAESEGVAVEVAAEGAIGWFWGLSDAERSKWDTRAGRVSRVAWVCWNLTGVVRTLAGMAVAVDALADDESWSTAVGMGQVMDAMERDLGGPEEGN